VTLVSGFGMSEAGTVFGMPPNLATIQRKLGSVGLPAPGVALRLVDASGNDCEAGQAGELWIRGDGVMRQYYQDEATTKVALTEDGWFKSGDILRRDADGYYWVMDRKKDMFISGGENVYPAEIEAVLGGYTGIKECAVVGVPDPKWGEVGCIVGVASEGCSPSKDEVLAFLKARLAGYKVPKHFVLQSSLPRTATGKLQKTQLKAQLVDALG